MYCLPHVGGWWHASQRQRLAEAFYPGVSWPRCAGPPRCLKPVGGCTLEHGALVLHRGCISPRIFAVKKFDYLHEERWRQITFICCLLCCFTRQQITFICCLLCCFTKKSELPLESGVWEGRSWCSHSDGKSEPPLENGFWVGSHRHLELSREGGFWVGRCWCRHSV